MCYLDLSYYLENIFSKENLLKKLLGNSIKLKDEGWLKLNACDGFIFSFF